MQARPFQVLKSIVTKVCRYFAYAAGLGMLLFWGYLAFLQSGAVPIAWLLLILLVPVTFVLPRLHTLDDIAHVDRFVIQHVARSFAHGLKVRLAGCRIVKMKR